MIQINTQGFNTTNEHVDSKIELVAVYEQRVVNIFLDYAMLTNCNVCIKITLPSNLLTRYIPRPWHAASGLTI